MLPSSSSSTITAASLIDGTTETSNSYRMRIEKERVKGVVTNLDAVAQACYKILNTERYAYVIYSWNYGIELQDLFGKPIPYVFAILPTRIKEALLQDDRVESVEDFELSHNGGDVLCKFTVNTIFGSLELTKEVQIS